MSSAPAAVEPGRAASPERAPRPPSAVLARPAAARLTMPVLLLAPAAIIIIGLVGYPLVRTVVYFNAVDTELAWGAGYETPDWRIDPRVFE